MDFISRCKRNGNTVIIPDGVNFIPDRAFFKDKNLEKVIIGKDVVFIGDMAFSFCINLKEVIFAPCSKCITFNHGAFMFCKKLSNINIPTSVKMIDEMCFFYNESLKSIIIPSSVNSMGNFVFALSGLEDIKFKSDTLFNFPKYIFLGMQKIKTFTICEEKKDVFLCEGYIVEKISNEKIIQDIKIQKGKNVLRYFDDSYIDDVWWRCSDIEEKTFTYGKDMRTIFNELRMKLNNDIGNKAISENWTLDTKISMQEYSLISDNCWHNIKIFMNEFGYSEDEKLSIRKIIELSRLQRNFNVFESFINKYIIKDDGTRNGVKIELKEENK